MNEKRENQRSPFALSAALLFLLFFEHLLVSGHPFRLFARFFGVLLHSLVEFFIADESAEEHHLHDCYEVGEQIIVAKAAGVTVEPYYKEYGHHVEGHEGHAGHMLRACRGVVGHVYLAGDEHGDTHKQGKKADVVAIERYVEREVEHRVV